MANLVIKSLGWCFLLTLGAAAQTGEAEREVKDVSYLDPSRKEKMDLYLPALKTGTTRPAVLWIHGGGWVGGDKAQAREKEVGSVLSAAGYVCASINYRLGNGAWPTNLLDCKNAVRFLRVHAAEYHIDPRHIAVMGGSAGGHLALMVGLTSGEPDLEPVSPYPGISSAVCAIGDFYGITDLATRQKVSATGTPQAILSPPDGRIFATGAGMGTPQLWRQASPVSHVRHDSPPVFIAHGLVDALVDYPQAQELDQVLSQQGVPHQLVLLPGVGHTFDLETWNHRRLPVDLKGQVLSFLSQSFENAVDTRTAAPSSN